MTGRKRRINKVTKGCHKSTCTWFRKWIVEIQFRRRNLKNWNSVLCFHSVTQKGSILFLSSQSTLKVIYLDDIILLECWSSFLTSINFYRTSLIHTSRLVVGATWTLRAKWKPMRWLKYLDGSSFIAKVLETVELR
jgi:hypothetical protein